MRRQDAVRHVWDADSVLVKWNTLTGALVEVGPVLDGVTPVDVDTLVIGLDGAAYVLDNELYRVDLAPGAATDLGALAALTTNACRAAVTPPRASCTCSVRTETSSPSTPWP